MGETKPLCFWPLLTVQRAETVYACYIILIETRKVGPQWLFYREGNEDLNTACVQK